MRQRQEHCTIVSLMTVGGLCFKAAIEGGGQWRSLLTRAIATVGHEEGLVGKRMPE